MNYLLSSTTVMNLLDLPNEIIEGIFKYVQEDDILQLKLVSAACAFSTDWLNIEPLNPGK